jgi:hypothetical protein
MEGFDWKEVLDVLLPVAATGLGAALAWALVKLRKVVKESDNKIDDAVLKAVEKAVEDSKKSS